MIIRKLPFLSRKSGKLLTGDLIDDILLVFGGKCWIGVPGLYFSGEQRAAGAFGFSQFMKPSDGELDLEEYEIEDEEHFGSGAENDFCYD